MIYFKYVRPLKRVIPQHVYIIQLIVNKIAELTNIPCAYDYVANFIAEFTFDPGVKITPETYCLGNETIFNRAWLNLSDEEKL